MTGISKSFKRIITLVLSLSMVFSTYTSVYAEEVSPDGDPVTYHTVSFDSKGGTTVQSQSVADGSLATRPSNPTKTNSTFDYWYLNEEGTAYDFSTPVTADIQLKAKWSSHMVYQRNLENKSSSPFTWEDDITVLKGVFSESKDDPYVNTPNYWTAVMTVNNRNVNDVIQGHESQLPASGQYSNCAAFEIAVNKYISSDAEYQNKLEATNFTHLNRPLTMSIDISSYRPMTGGYLNGCTVYDIHGGTVTEVECDYNSDTNIIYIRSSEFSDYLIYMTWGHTVTFETNGGSAVAAQEVGDGSKAVKPQNPTKKDSLFIGWYSDPELKNVYDFNTPVKSNITLYAKWDSRFTITFDTDGGNPKPDSQVVATGGLATKPEKDPSKADHKFIGWYLGNNKYDFATPVTQSITLKAKYESTKPKLHIVYFDVNGAEKNIDNQIVSHGFKATKPEDPKKDGYKFKYWAVWENNKEDKDLKEFKWDTMITDSIRLRAIFEKNDSGSSSGSNSGSGSSTVKALSTVAVVDTGSKYIYAGTKSATIVDKVTYTGLLETGKSYTLKGYLVNKMTGQPITDASGMMVASTIPFTATSEGTALMSFTFNPSALPAGTTIVVYEEVYNTDNKLVAEHKDPNDMNQSIFIMQYAKVQTGVYPFDLGSILKEIVDMFIDAKQYLVS